jgi:hypothetical protein
MRRVRWLKFKELERDNDISLYWAEVVLLEAQLKRQRDACIYITSVEDLKVGPG